uniref:Uncharacterized protein n=1 Tax=Micrurus surinamensis TaxID=129470 RepID=A0A2D4NXN2_MICSU
MKHTKTHYVLCPLICKQSQSPAGCEKFLACQKDCTHEREDSICIVPIPRKIKRKGTCHAQLLGNSAKTCALQNWCVKAAPNSTCWVAAGEPICFLGCFCHCQESFQGFFAI